MIDLLRELPSKADPSLFKVERWCTPDEGLILYALCQVHEIRTVLECGTANGYSALWMAAAGAHVNTWDIVERPRVWSVEQYVCPPTAGAIPIRCHIGPFHEGVGNVHAPGPRLFFIDGEHNRSATRRDWKAIKPLLTPGDVMVFHDALEYENIADLSRNLRAQGYRGGIIRTQRGMAVHFA